MAEKTTCDQKEIVALLPWYTVNSLSEDEHSQVEKHLAHCNSCKVELDEMKWLSEGFLLSQNGDRHINSVLLTIYSENKKELGGDLVHRINDHLSTCSDCTKELEILIAVNHSLINKPAESILLGLKQAVETFFSNRLLRPAFAYALVLLLLYPAWLGLYKRSDKSEQLMEPINISNNFLLENTNQRGISGSSITIDLGQIEDMFTLSLNLPAFEKDDFTLDAKISNADNVVVWQYSNLQLIDEYGSVLLLCDKSYFSEEMYSLIVTQINIHTKKSGNEYNYVFKVRE